MKRGKRNPGMKQPMSAPWGKGGKNSIKRDRKGGNKGPSKAFCMPGACNLNRGKEYSYSLREGRPLDLCSRK